MKIITHTRSDGKERAAQLGYPQVRVAPLAKGEDQINPSKAPNPGQTCRDTATQGGEETPTKRPPKSVKLITEPRSPERPWRTSGARLRIAGAFSW